MLVTGQLHLLLVFWLFSFFINNEAMYQSFGFDTRPTLIGFLLFQVCMYDYDCMEATICLLAVVAA